MKYMIMDIEPLAEQKSFTKTKNRRGANCEKETAHTVSILSETISFYLKLIAFKTE